VLKVYKGKRLGKKFGKENKRAKKAGFSKAAYFFFFAFFFICRPPGKKFPSPFAFFYAIESVRALFLKSLAKN